jgi:hypothetical protein
MTPVTSIPRKLATSTATTSVFGSGISISLPQKHTQPLKSLRNSGTCLLGHQKKLNTNGIVEYVILSAL